jgi:hypothetical protein
LSFITARYLAKPESFAHSSAALLPHFCANRLSLRASEKPISRVARTNLLSRSPSNFLVIDRMRLAKMLLRMQRATLIVKSMSTLSILFKALNHTPERMAFIFSFISCLLSMKLEVVSFSTISGTVRQTSESIP